MVTLKAIYFCNLIPAEFRNQKNQTLNTCCIVTFLFTRLYLVIKPFRFSLILIRRKSGCASFDVFAKKIRANVISDLDLVCVRFYVLMQTVMSRFVGVCVSEKICTA